MVHTAIILAGGLGTRLRDTVPDLPKPMAPIAGRPFLEYQLDYWIAQGIKRFILSVGYKHEKITDYFGSTYQSAAIDYVVETTPLGTGGGFLLATQKLQEESSFLLLNGDTYFEVELKKLKHFAETHDADWCFSLFQTQDTQRYMGMDVSPNGQIQSCRLDTKGTALANGGVYWVNRRVIENLATHPCSLETDLFPQALASKQRLFGMACDGIFIDIGVPQDYHRSASILV